MMIENAKARHGGKPGALSNVFPAKGKGIPYASEYSATARPSQLVEG